MRVGARGDSWGMDEGAELGRGDEKSLERGQKEKPWLWADMRQLCSQGNAVCGEQ